VALKAVKEWAGEHDDLEEIRFVLFSDRDLAAYEEALAELSG
jgi:O-acetyl-ADP-ribose deacetylase (regulator of RNase III)